MIFRDDVLDADDERLQSAGLRAYGLLESTLADIAEQHDPGIDVNNSARLCWSMVQGLVQLQAKFADLDTTLGLVPVDIEDRAELFTEMIVAGLLGSRR